MGGAELAKGPLVADVRFQERFGGRTYVPILRPGNDPAPIGIIHIEVDGYGRDEGLAYARLFVAAPDLRDAVQTLLSLHIAHHNTPEHVAARAALAKADTTTEGE